MKAVIFIHVLYLILTRTFIVVGDEKCQSKIELRAVLLSCPAKDSGCDDDDPLSQVMLSEEAQILQANAKNFENLKIEKEKGFPNKVKDCKRKLIITVKVKNFGKIPCDDEYIIIDHVFDPVSGGKGRLLSPVILKLRQEQMVQLYGLQFQRVVNSDPFEVHKENEKTCSVNTENSSCGVTTYDGKPLTFSEGFCCSKDLSTNIKRQLSQNDIFQENRLSRPEKSYANIYDPELVQLKSKTKEDTSADKDDSNHSKPETNRIKELTGDKVPNYLFERDRKIVCDKGDFLTELCNLQKEKNGEKEKPENVTTNSTIPPETTTSTNSYLYDINNNLVANDKLPFRDKNLAGFFHKNIQRATPSSEKIKSKNEEILENLLEELIAERNSKVNLMNKKASEFEQIKLKEVSRGKRENRQDFNKKLTLEEKLENFFKSRYHRKKRRKRLFELPHKRFQKAKIQCRDTECTTTESVLVTDLPAEYVTKGSPPKYFFSHDKIIVHPAESSQIVSNSTTKSSDDIDYEDSKYGSSEYGTFEIKTDTCSPETTTEPSNKNCELEGRKKEKKDKKKYEKESRKEKNQKNEEKMTKVKSRNFKEYHKEQKFESEKENDRNFDDHERAKNLESEAFSNRNNERKEEKEKNSLDFDMENYKYEKNRPHKKTYLILANERKPENKKIKNFFISKNHGKQKLKPDSVKFFKKFQQEIPDEEESKFKKPMEEIFEMRKNFKTEDNINNKKNYNEKQNHDDKKDQEKYYEDQNKKNFEDQNKKNFEDQNKKNFEDQNKKCFEDQNKKNYEFSKKKLEPENVDTTGIKLPSQRTHENTVTEWKTPQREGKPVAVKKFRPFEASRKPRPYGYKFMEDDKNVNFNVEIIQRKFPETSTQRIYPYKTYQTYQTYHRLGNVIPYTDIVKSMTPRTRLPNNHRPLLYYQTGPKYYILGNRQQQQKQPQQPQDGQQPQQPMPQPQPKVIYIKSGGPQKYYSQGKSRFDLPQEKANYRLQQSYEPHAHKKHTRHYYAPESLYTDEVNLHLNKPNNLNNLYFSNYHRRDPQIIVRENSPSKFRFNTFEEENSQGWKVRNKRNTDYLLEEDPDPESKGKKKTLEESENKINKREENSKGFSAEDISHLEEMQNKISYPFISYRKESCEKEKVAKRHTNDKQRLIQSYLNAPDYILEELKEKLEGKEEAEPNKRDTTKTYDRDNLPKEVAHCMRYGDMWYAMYAIKKPMVAQIVGIQLFDKHTLCDGTSEWRDLTKGSMVRVGTFLPKAEDDLPTMSVSFLGGKTNKVHNSIDSDNYFLLIPSHVSDPSKVENYPQFEGGPEEYLLVNSKDVSDGEDCNMVGTSFEAFAQQPDRCYQKMGSCLKRQPVDLWREDMEARIKGKKGKYFLENFGNIPNSSIKTYTNFTGDFLALEYYGEYTSTVEIEFKADSNAIIRKGSVAQIPSVFIDSTYPKKTRIILTVLNIGLTSSYFRPRLGDCPPDLDPAWCPLEGPLVTIPPHQRHDFKLDLSGLLPPNKISLSVQVLNQMNKKIAYRKISIKKGERCVCAFHCRCTCIGNLKDGRTCYELPLEDYRAAGYIGSFPFRGGANSSASENFFRNIHITLLTAGYLLLIFGCVKAILGIFCRKIGISGIRILTGPRELCSYYESELRRCTVLFDEYGFPVHPTTLLPVQIVPLFVEAILNIFFFFLYPLRGLCYIICYLACWKALCSECDGCCPQDETFTAYEQSCSSPLLSKSYQHSCVNYNLTSFNTKKGKAEEFLPYLPYKGDDDPLEEDDTEFVLQEMKKYRKK